ncbi:SWIM zinc finger family protein, partial [Azospirillum griseum]
MIPLSSLQRLFDAATFSRGAAYQREGRVSALQAQRLANGAIRLSVTVRGSHRIPYTQSIRFQRAGNTLSALSGECDCPIGFNCKHVAAALIAWALSSDEPTAPTTTRRVPSDPEFSPPQTAVPALSPPLQALLSRLSDAAAIDGGEVYPETVRKRLLYVLRLDGGAGSAEAVVQPLSVSIRKDGAFGADEKPYGFEQSRSLATVKFVTPSDRTILTSLAQNTLAVAGRRDEGSVLRGEWSGWLVERMLKTGRLHWQDFRANPPLRSGPTRRGTACWVADERGQQRFSIALDSPAALTLPTTPLLYVDRESGECGVVEADVRPHLA